MNRSLNHRHGEQHLQELRLFLEEICCNLCRFRHVEEDGLAPESIQISQEVSLGAPGAFADIRVRLPGAEPYFVEIKYGHPADRIVAHMARKYKAGMAALPPISKVVLVVDSRRHADWPAVQRAIEVNLPPGWRLEVWDEDRLGALIESRFGMRIEDFSEEDVAELRGALDNAKGRYAFGSEWNGGELQTSLLWHFGFWRLKQFARNPASTRGPFCLPACTGTWPC